MSELSGGSSSTFTEEHDLEALEVAEVSTGRLASNLLHLGKARKFLLKVELFAGFNDLAGSLSALQIHSELCHLQSLHRVHHSFEVWSVNEHAVLIGDVGNHDLLAVVGAIVNESDTTALHKVFSSWLNVTSYKTHLKSTNCAQQQPMYVNKLTISSSI